MKTEFERRRFSIEQIKELIREELKETLEPIVQQTGQLIVGLEKRISELEESVNGLIRIAKNEYN